MSYIKDISVGNIGLAAFFSTHLGMIHLRLIPISEWKHYLVVTEIMAYKYTQKQNKLINTM